MSIQRALAALGAGVIVGFTGFGAAAQVTTQEQGVVYGQDDRVEPFEHPEEAVRRLAMESSVTLVLRPNIDVSNPDDIQIDGDTLSQSIGLCEGERFASQPTGGFCSGTLVGPDMIMTAGHCFPGGDASCRQISAVFNYMIEEDGGVAQLSLDDVYNCRRVIAQADSSGPTRDYTIFQLDRPVSDRFTPANVRSGSGPVSEGTELLMIGSPSGLPLKVDDGGVVRDSRESGLSTFEASTDSFGGNSGSGVWDLNTLEIVGILVSGTTDYVSDGTCQRVNRCEDDGCDGEDVMYAFRAVDAFCNAATDEALCGTSSSCGDGFCAFDEDETSCSSDCTANTCGDGYCSADEWTTCDADCASNVPDTWTCNPSYYGTADGCDCECGAYDPDCDFSAEAPLNCGSFQTCSDTGECVGGAGSELCNALPWSQREQVPFGFLLIGLGVIGIMIGRRV